MTIDEIIERHFPRGNEFVSYSHAAAKEACRRAVKEALEMAAKDIAPPEHCRVCDESSDYVCHACLQQTRDEATVRALAATLEKS